jgi:hypothetical protein
MKLATGVNFVITFWCNLGPWWHNNSQNLRQYADRVVNYIKKGVNLINPSFIVVDNEPK